MGISANFIICIGILNLLKFSSSDKAEEYTTGLPAPCGSIRVISKNSIYTISDQALHKSKGEFLLKLKRGRRSALPPNGDERSLNSDKTILAKSRNERSAPNFPSAKGIGRSIALRQTGIPQKCAWIFKKGPNCEKLLVKLLHMVDGGRDCRREYVRITGGNQTELFCGQSYAISDHPSFVTDEDKLFIQHYKVFGITPPDEDMKFAGIVRCA